MLLNKELSKSSYSFCNTSNVWMFKQQTVWCLLVTNIEGNIASIFNSKSYTKFEMMMGLWWCAFKPMAVGTPDSQQIPYPQLPEDCLRSRPKTTVMSQKCAVQRCPWRNGSSTSSLSFLHAALQVSWKYYWSKALDAFNLFLYAWWKTEIKNSVCSIQFPGEIIPPPKLFFNQELFLCAQISIEVLVGSGPPFRVKGNTWITCKTHPPSGCASLLSGALRAIMTYIQKSIQHYQIFFLAGNWSCHYKLHMSMASILKIFKQIGHAC